jgi:hypothetical protein
MCKAGANFVSRTSAERPRGPPVLVEKGEAEEATTAETGAVHTPVNDSISVNQVSALEFELWRRRILSPVL